MRPTSNPTGGTREISRCDAPACGLKFATTWGKRGVLTEEQGGSRYQIDYTMAIESIT